MHSNKYCARMSSLDKPEYIGTLKESMEISRVDYHCRSEHSAMSMSANTVWDGFTRFVDFTLQVIPIIDNQSYVVLPWPMCQSLSELSHSVNLFIIIQ